MISMVYALVSGNALGVLLQPPAGVVRMRLLRKDADTFTGWDDPTALPIHDGPPERYVVDASSLYNGARVFYRAYYLIGGLWVATSTVPGDPVAAFNDASVDVLKLVRDRLDLGLTVYVQRGLLNHTMGHIPVMTASPLVEEVPLPVMTVHVASDSSDQRFVGDMVVRDTFSLADGQWHSLDGWYSRHQLTLVGWCLNSDERIILRNAVKTVLMSNMPVFDASGLMQVDMQFSDQEDFVSYAAPVYQAVCNFTCYAPSAVERVDPAIRDVVFQPVF